MRISSRERVKLAPVHGGGKDRGPAPGAGEENAGFLRGGGEGPAAWKKGLEGPLRMGGGRLV